MIARAGAQRCLRVEEQLDVDVGGVQWHRLGAQDDVERSLVEQINSMLFILDQETQSLCFLHTHTHIYLRVSLEGISQLAVCLRAVLIGCADDRLFFLQKRIFCRKRDLLNLEK